jgi:peroxiredoxin Q/BCP
MGIERSTFIIDKDGIVRKIMRKVKVPNHVKEVIEEIKKLG